MSLLHVFFASCLLHRVSGVLVTNVNMKPIFSTFYASLCGCGLFFKIVIREVRPSIFDSNSQLDATWKTAGQLRQIIFWHVHLRSLVTCVTEEDASEGFPMNVSDSTPHTAGQKSVIQLGRVGNFDTTVYIQDKRQNG